MAFVPITVNRTIDPIFFQYSREDQKTNENTGNFFDDLIEAAKKLLNSLKCRFKNKEVKRLNEIIARMEIEKNEYIKLLEKKGQEEIAAKAKLSKAKEEFSNQQKNIEKQIRKEKEKIQSRQEQRELARKARYDEWERTQKSLLETEQTHLRKVEENLKGGFKRNYEEHERQMEIKRRELAEEKEILENNRLDNERRLEEEKERLRQLQASYEREIEEKEKQLERQVTAFEEDKKRWDEERKAAKQNYDELTKKMAEGYQQLTHHQQVLEDRIKSKLDDLMEKQTELTEQEQDNKLMNLIETYLDYYNLYSTNPKKMMRETSEFQRKFKLQIVKVKNSMEPGDNFLSRLNIWIESVKLDMKMTLYLCVNGEDQMEAAQKTIEQYKRNFDEIKSKFNNSIVDSPNDETNRQFQLFHDFLQEADYRRAELLVGSSSPPLAIPGQTDGEGIISIHTRTEGGATGGGDSTVAVQQGGWLQRNTSKIGAAMKNAIKSRSEYGY